jgi:hypothetical protein
MMKYGIIIRMVNGDTYAHVCESYNASEGSIIMILSTNRNISYNLANVASVDIEKLEGYASSRVPTEDTKATEDEEAWIDDNIESVLF